MQSVFTNCFMLKELMCWAKFLTKIKRAFVSPCKLTSFKMSLLFDDFLPKEKGTFKAPLFFW